MTLLSALRGETKWGDVVPYSLAQATGALLGVLCAHTMFSLARYSLSHHVRSGAPQFFSEGIATLGLLLVIAGCSRFRSPATPYAVAAYITGAYWFTSSTSFANPAVTLARSLTDTFAGIRPADVPGFLLGQLAGLAVAVLLCRCLFHRNLVQKVAEAGEDHGEAETITSGDNVVIAD